MNTPCICPELDCSPVLSCVNNDLLRISSGDSELTNLCAAVTKCVDAEFKNISNGASNQFNYYAQSIVKILQSLDGYSDSGDTYLSSSNGSFIWINSTSLSHTYVENGNGVTVTGGGFLNDPYRPNISNVYVQNLISAVNGLSYSSGVVKLGGSLNQSTLITGSGFSFGITGAGATSISGSSFDAKGSLSLTNYGELTLNGFQAVVQLVNGSRAYALEFNDIAGMITLGTSQDITIEDGTQLNPSVIGTNKTYFKIANYHHKSVGDILSLANISTGEVQWISSGSIGIPYTDEKAQDAIGSILLNTSTINFNYNDNNPSLSGDVNDNSITFTKIQTVNQNVLIGRSTAGVGIVGELTVGGGIEFNSSIIQVGAFIGDVTKSAGGSSLIISNNAVTNTKLRQSAGYSVIGKPDTGTGSPSDITAGPDQILMRAGSGNLVFGTVVTNNIGDDQVTFNKVQNINTQRILGRSTTGTGNIEELTIGSGILVSGGVLSTFGRPLIGISRFTTSGTWTKPVGCNSVLVYVVGAGGGGGGALGNTAQTAVGAGGGAGGYSINYITSGLGGTETVTVGMGGVGGFSGSIIPYQGNDATGSSFGSHVSVSGGLGGETLATGTSIAKADGGIGGGGSLVISTTVSTAAGDSGTEAIRFSAAVASFAKGGSSILGAPYNSGFTGTGAGGYGNFETGTSAGVAGFDGGNGIVIVYEFS